MHEGDTLKKQGYHYFNGLKYALTSGISNYAEDTDERTLFFQEHQHLVSGTMLVSVFSYLESTLGENWIDRCGGKQKRELECLKFIRDAFVHKNGHLRDLGSYTQAKEDDLLLYIQELKQGTILDDRGNAYPCYIDLTNNGVVTLNEESIHILFCIGKAICH